MDLQFNQTVLRCLECTANEYQSQEQTQEVRLPEDLPDVGTVLGCWGQVVLRGKEWRSDYVGISGGVMGKVLYMPDQGEIPQCVDVWLPFQMKWSIPGGRQDGTLSVRLCLRGADARALSSRKLMVRTNVGVQMEALSPAQHEISQPEGVPEDVRLLHRQYTLTLPTEAGEKAFALEETLEMNQSEPRPEHVMHISLLPQVLEQKVLADKMIFRGLCIAHILYRAGDGRLYSRDFDIPFSQYSELGREFEPDAQVSVEPAVTNLELDQTPEGELRLRAGICGQYVVYDRMQLNIAADAYSPVRAVEPVFEPLSIPMTEERSTQTVTAQTDPMTDVMRPVDVCFRAEPAYLTRDDQTMEAELGGTFQLLFYDPEGNLQCSQARWDHRLQYPSEEDRKMTMVVRQSGKPQFGAGLLNADLLVETQTASAKPITGMTGLEMGQPVKPDPNRPSLVVTRADGNSLWTLAKANGSSVERICDANDLQTEPQPQQILLIPVI